MNDKMEKTIMANGCEVTLFFKKQPNTNIQQNVLGVLLSSYDKRKDNVVNKKTDNNTVRSLTS